MLSTSGSVRNPAHMIDRARINSTGPTLENVWLAATESARLTINHVSTWNIDFMRGLCLRCQVGDECVSHSQDRYTDANGNSSFPRRYEQKIKTAYCSKR